MPDDEIPKADEELDEEELDEELDDDGLKDEGPAIPEEDDML